MQDNENNNNLDKPIIPPSSNEPNEETTLSPMAVIAICFGLFLAGNLISGGIMIVMAKMYGMDMATLLKSLSENTPVGTRNFMRMVLFLNHVFSFILPALATAYIAYKNRLWAYFKLGKFPTLQVIGLAFLWLLVSMPFVQYSYQLNKMLPLPEWMMQMEDSTSGMLQAIVAKENFYEIIVNVFLIGVIPGIGEELMFRGIIQQQMGRIFKDEHFQVWMSAAIFSAIHMQFQGFLARMILGALLGYLLVWTRSLWVPMIVHFLNNGLQVIGLYVMNVKPSEMDKLDQSDKIHWTVAGIFLMGTLALGKYIRDTYYKIDDLTPPTPEGKGEHGW
jgi:uncharacterized protein